MSRGTTLASLAGMVVLTFAGAVQGADLVLNCVVHASRPDHGRTEWRRRLIIDLASRAVRVLDDFGGGFTQRAQYVLAGATPQRLILENSPTKQTFVDGRTGRYSLHDRSMNFSLNGRCAKSGVRP